MRPGAEIPIIHPRTWNISHLSAESVGLDSLGASFPEIQVYVLARGLLFSPFLFLFVSFFTSRLTADSFFNFRSRPLPTLSNGEAREYIRWSRVHAVSNTFSLGAARKFIADLFLQISREIDKYSSFSLHFIRIQSILQLKRSAILIPKKKNGYLNDAFFFYTRTVILHRN